MKFKTLISACCTLFIINFIIPSFAALPNQRTNLKVLILAATGTEPSTAAWQASLSSEGVPYDLWIVGGPHTPLTAASFSTTAADGSPVALYQGIVVATDTLSYTDELGNWTSALSADEWSALQAYESTYGIRQVTAYIYPQPSFGLNYPTFGGDLGGIPATLTTPGKSVFSYLKGPIAIDSGSWGYLATARDPVNYVSLLNDNSGNSLLGVYTHTDTRQEMVVSVGTNPTNMQNLLLRHGMLNWLTKGLYLGYSRFYFALHVDDFFLPDASWDPVSHTSITLKPDLSNLNQMIFIQAGDIVPAIQWANANGFKFDWLYNGVGYSLYGGANNATFATLLANKSSVRWINHTYNHYNLDNITGATPPIPAPLSTIENTLANNIAFATTYGLSINKSVFVSGGDSGLFSPYMATALSTQKIKWIGDNSLFRPTQQKLGTALTIPRHPTNVYYNVSTNEQQLDEFNYLYLPPSLGGTCVASATIACATAPADWPTYLAITSDQILRHILANDPLPHYMHQSNLTGDGILYSVMNATFTKYKKFIKPAFINMEYVVIGQLLQKTATWNTAMNTGLVSGYVQNGLISITSNAKVSLQVPITGSTLGSAYGGTRRSVWQTVLAGQTVTLTAAP